MFSVEELHRRLHRRYVEFEIEELSLSEALDRLSKLLDRILDLTFFSYLANDDEAALAVLSMDSEIEKLCLNALARTVLSVGRSYSRAIGSLGVVQFINAIDKAMDYLRDLAFATATGYGVQQDLSRYLPAVTDDIVAVLRINREVSEPIEKLEDRFPVDVIAIRRTSRVELVVNKKTRLRKGDTIYVAGFREGVQDLAKEIGDELKVEEPSSSLRDVIGGISSSRLLTKLIIDLVFYVARTRSELGLVAEIEEMEMYMDQLCENLLRAIERIEEPNTRSSLARLVLRLEDLVDAFTAVIHIPMRDPYREVFDELIERGEERYLRLSVERRAKVLDLARALDDYGARIVAIRKPSEWIAVTPFNIYKLDVEPGDAVLILYPTEFDEEVRARVRSLGLSPQEVSEE